MTQHPRETPPPPSDPTIPPPPNPPPSLSPPTISHISLNRYSSPIGIAHSRPSISWRFSQTKSTAPSFSQKAYEIKIQRFKPAGSESGNGVEPPALGSPSTYRVYSESNVYVPWPTQEADLKSRERVKLGVRAWGGGEAEWTDWCEIEIEVALLDAKKELEAKIVTPDIEQSLEVTKRPWYARKSFTIDEKELEGFKKSKGGTGSGVRIYATAFGAYFLELNGKRIGDHVLAPGWQSYKHRLHYQTYIVPWEYFVAGENVIGAIVGEAWYAGRMSWDGNNRNIFGKHLGVLVQLEIDGVVKVVTGEKEKWKWAFGPLITSEIYDGETYEVALEDKDWSKPPATKKGSSWTWRDVKELEFLSSTELISPEAPPIRRIEEVKAISVITTPSGKKVLDFGQNLVGWIKLKKVPSIEQTGGTSIIIKTAEVLEHGELSQRPLRSAKATFTIVPGPKEKKDYEAHFSFQGFRYALVEGCEVEKENFVAVVFHTDMERVGTFECSSKDINQLHKNIVWSLRGNMVGIPSDCPQRDERLGWTGDIQVFTPTATFLYNTTGFLANWLDDLSVEQLKDHNGTPNIVSPDVLQMLGKAHPQAIWADVVSLTPQAIYNATGNRQILEDMYESMTAWLDVGLPRTKNGLWLQAPETWQYGDWLDPRAPLSDAAKGLTDPFLAANAYLVHCTGVVATISKLLNKPTLAYNYAQEKARLRHEFQKEYVSPNGRLVSDSQTALSLALHFDLLEKDQRKTALDRLVHLIKGEGFRIGTGFAGTPIILLVLAENERLDIAYQMLQEKGCPSWLYPVSMGATTIWERWDSMLPDGTINPGEMTSFNHYALGSVGNFLHTIVAGISPLTPGWKRVLIHPQPGGTLTSAKATHLSPYGLVSCEWTIEDEVLVVKAQVPPNTTARVVLPSKILEVGSGFHTFRAKWDGKKE